MKKLLLILLCIPLIFSCGNNESSNERKNKSLDRLSETFNKGCIEGNKGNSDWEAYCDCAGKNFSNQLKEMDEKDMENITEDDGFSMGMNAGLDCVHLLENNEEDLVQTDKMEEMMYNMLYNECLTGNEGNSDWEAYCKCAADIMIESVPNIDDWADMTEEEGYQIGIDAGMECLYLLE